MIAFTVTDTRCFLRPYLDSTKILQSSWSENKHVYTVEQIFFQADKDANHWTYYVLSFYEDNNKKKIIRNKMSVTILQKGTENSRRNCRIVNNQKWAL